MIDTNVLISAVLRGGVPERILKAARSGEVSGIVSLHILGELRDVLTRSRFGVDAEFCEVVAVERATASWSADPDDDPVVEAALQGRADVVVTGDAHLLVLEVPGVRFLRPAELATELHLEADPD